MNKQVIFAGAALALIAGCSRYDRDRYNTGDTYTRSTSTGTYDNGGSTRTATQNGPYGTPQGTTLRAMDSDFLREANTGNLKEVEMARVAVRQTTNEKVRSFAQRMIDDHTKMNQELTQLAREKGLNLGEQLPQEARSDINRIGNVNGADFDRQYVKEMVQDHEKDADAFDRQARTGEDASVRSLASRCLPTIREHLRMAKDLDTNMNAPQIGQPRYNTPRGTPDSNPMNPNPSNPSGPDSPGSPANPSNPNNPGNPSEVPGTPESPR
jgi:putative membrane protein